jgi:hypothetical protein
MMNGITFESLLKESVRQDFYEAADKEIAKHLEQFEKEMADMKHEMVGKLVDKIHIFTQKNPVDNEVVIKVRIGR